MRKTLTIDSSAYCVHKYVSGFAVVVIDVIRATTTAVSAVAAGRRCFAVTNVEEAFRLREQLDDCLMVGEVEGRAPPAFHMNNSPALLAERNDFRPIILLSSSGTQLMTKSQLCDSTYLCCFRNYRATATYLAFRNDHVAVIGAGSRGEFREEDQLCCAWVGRELMKYGFEPANQETMRLLERCRTGPLESCLVGKSAEYLKNSGQLSDLTFVREHVDDLDAVFEMHENEVVRVTQTG
jgi:2-phosphosulfolactate phosphatase